MKFKHKPKLGDIIYSLPFIKYKGGGTLYLDPDSEFFPGERDQWIEKFKWLMPLIKEQPYIENVKIYKGEHFDIDLDFYMNTTHLKFGDKVNIVDNHFIGQGVKPMPYEPWLTCGKMKLSAITVAQSGGYYNNVDYKKLLEIKHCIFIGTKKEVCDFGCKFELDISTGSDYKILELTRIINGADLFIGNQSLPLAIALGLGKKCWVEQHPAYPNCIMGNYKNICV